MFQPLSGCSDFYGCASLSQVPSGRFTPLQSIVQALGIYDHQTRVLFLKN